MHVALRGLEASVPREFLDRRDGDAGHREVATERVAEDVRAFPFEPGRSLDFLEPLGHGLVRRGPAVVTPQHVCPLEVPVLAQSLREPWRQREPASAVALGRALMTAPDRSRDGDGLCLEVDVAPLEADHLPAPQTRLPAQEHGQEVIGIAEYLSVDHEPIEGSWWSRPSETGRL